MSKTTIIHHSADFDGLFCGAIAKKFLPDAEVIGWDFGDKPLPVPAEGTIYILDLPVDRVFGGSFSGSKLQGWIDSKFFVTPEVINRIVWIDHHASSIASHPTDIPGYRIDGVAACRLAWQWFTCCDGFIDKRFDPELLPMKRAYVDRAVKEPLAVRLAGEYDIWDKRDPRAETFQFGLRSVENFEWENLLGSASPAYCDHLLRRGELLQRYQQRNDANLVNYRSFIMEFEGLKFLTLNTARCNSMTFTAKDVPETGHDALCGFYWTGKNWKVSMYHARHRMDLDLSKIAVKHGGGGHKGACGFEAQTLPWL